eukprot:CAMPEP_0174869606 /NCGR_PEP_ID=MMETSP1114-20130205/68153_1 /TAXON_ID=312471 /ORGANISM="Neobodo designis, Strain CCAP 1951/1" /LENGTH=64 /DNA_ID=CAMNT_0016104857 /DNA_START=164 /DNA_END=355 /DNA_ORIENTATION=+
MAARFQAIMVWCSDAASESAIACAGAPSEVRSNTAVGLTASPASPETSAGARSSRRGEPSPNRR